MRQGVEPNIEIWGARLTTLANWVIRVVGVAIFTFLSWYSMRYTQYVNPLGKEYPINVWDSAKRNIFFVGIAVIVVITLMFIESRMTEKIRMWVMRIAISMVGIWIGCWSVWWVMSVDRQPVGDQAFIYGGASYFMEGQFSFLGKGGYCGIYPHQLGLIALVELLFHVVGAYNYLAYQLICTVLAVGIVLLGYTLLRQITDSLTVVLSYCILMSQCVPLVFYTSWVYGEIPSVFFSLMTALCLIKYEKTGNKRWLLGMTIAILMAVLVRKNSLIMLIAVCLVGGVYMLHKKDKRFFVAILIAAILPGLVYEGIYKIYEVRSGIPHSEGVLPVSFIVMGMQENDGKYGWYNNYCKDAYYEADMNLNDMKEICKEDLSLRLAEFREDPSYMVHFFKEKVLSQWNMPLYQSLYFNSQYWEGKEPEADSFVSKLNGEYLVEVLGVCDRIQFILFVGMLLYYIFAVRKDSDILQHMLAVTIIGGFFFSIIWEAMARYIFPYYIMMFPLAAIGYWKAISQIQALFGRKQKQKSDDNIIPFERVA